MKLPHKGKHFVGQMRGVLGRRNKNNNKPDVAAQPPTHHTQRELHMSFRAIPHSDRLLTCATSGCGPLYLKNTTKTHTHTLRLQVADLCRHCQWLWVSIPVKYSQNWHSEYRLLTCADSGPGPLCKI